MNFLRMIGISLLVGLPLCIVANQDIYAITLSAVGDWQTIDHETNQPSSIIRIWKFKDKYYGKIVKIYRENGHQPTDRCAKCLGALYNRPLLGMTIIYDFLAIGDGKYVEGRILDPTSGKVYHCRMRVLDNNQRLKLRGYVGLLILGRTDIWIRFSKQAH